MNRPREVVTTERRRRISQQPELEADTVRGTGKGGPPPDPPDPPERLTLPFAAFLVLASVATAGVALWLFFVTAFVLPAQDAAHIPMWRAIAVSFCAFCALSWGCVATGGRRALLRWPLLAISGAAIALGLFGVIDMLRRANESGDFEGYILLMGLILSGHGLAGVLYALRPGVTARLQVR